MTDTAIRATVLVGGHPYAASELHEMLGSLEPLAGVTTTVVAWPEAEAVFAPGGLDGTDALVLYDMPGVGLRRGALPEPQAPPPVVVEGWARLLAEGVPVVALHHSIASWPAWPEFAEFVGGRYHYAPGRLRGVDYPDSGYALEVPQTLTVLAPDHPVCAGLPATFELTDETYLCPIFADDVTALVGTNAPLDADHHYATTPALLGRLNVRDGWAHPPGVPLSAWTHRVGRSSVVYVQPGDGPSAYANPNYRRLLANAIRWVVAERAVWR